jgi:hypothetical protein
MDEQHFFTHRLVPESGIKLEGPWRPDQVERIRAFAERVRTEPYFVQPIRSESDDSED